jgi:hypothetical protein
MSFAERLAQQIKKAPARTTYNDQAKAYDWQREANSKRALR